MFANATVERRWTQFAHIYFIHGFTAGNVLLRDGVFGSWPHIPWGIEASFKNACTKVSNCPVLPDYLRSEIWFSLTCNIPNLISCIYRITLLALKSFTIVVYLHGCTTACALKQTFPQCKVFLEGTLILGMPVTQTHNVFIDALRRACFVCFGALLHCWLISSPPFTLVRSSSNLFEQKHTKSQGLPLSLYSATHAQFRNKATCSQNIFTVWWRKRALHRHADEVIGSQTVHVTDRSVSRYF